MFKKITLLTILAVIIFSSLTAAVEVDDFDKNLLVKVFKDVDSKDIEYMAELGLDSKDISLVLYYYSNSNKRLDRDDLNKLVRNRERINEFHYYFGMPAVIFDNDLLRFRHPYRERHFPPLNTKKYDKKYKFNGGEEKIKIRGNNYDYKYKNKRTGVEEKIEIKKQKYKYEYKDRNMEEKFEVNYANNKYKYHYKNFNTGREIKKEGRGRPVNRYLIYEELKEKYYDMEKDDYEDDDFYDDEGDYYEEDDYYDEDDDSGIDVQVDIKIDLSDIFN